MLIAGAASSGRKPVIYTSLVRPLSTGSTWKEAEWWRSAGLAPATAQ